MAVAAIAVAVVAIGVHWGTWVAGGADSYGYISQSRLWQQGRALAPQPLPLHLALPEPAWALAPLEYRPSTDGQGIVPIVPPGLPIAMAVFAAVGGASAVYLVVPLFGAVAVWMTGRLGQRLGGMPVAIGGAALMATSPTFLYQLVQPMSDVPATACWLAALVWASEGSTRSRTAAGLAAALAILVRPNLAPLASVVVAIASLSQTPVRVRLREGLQVAVPAALAVVAMALLQHHWYGSALRSGYGPASYLYAASRVVPNLVRYPAWLAETHTPLILLGLAWPVLAWRHRSDDRRVAWACWGTAMLVAAAYLPYIEFDVWWYTRFLLPAIPLLWLLVGSVAARASAGLWAVLVALLVVFQLHAGWSRDVFRLHSYEQRYLAVAKGVRVFTPPAAAILTVQHSGVLRMYANRLTVRWDAIPPKMLDRAIADLRDRGRTPMLVIDYAERTAFVKRFEGASRYGRLDWPPLYCAGNACLFDPVNAPITPPSGR